MPYLGSYAINDYLTFAVNTHNNKSQARDADSVPTYRIYENETTVPILTGNMALLDGANTVGFYSEQIQLTAASGFELDKVYTIYITATVQGTQGTISHTFQIPTPSSSSFNPATDTVIVSSGTVTNIVNPVNVAGYVVVTGTVNANIVSSNNIDFTALQKTSLNTSTPMAIQGGYVSVSGTITSVVGGYVLVTGTVDANVIQWRGTQPNVLQANRVDSYIGVNNDKTGYDLSGAGVLAVQAGLATPTNITAGTITSVTNDVGITQAGADKVWNSVSRTLTSFGTLTTDTATAVFTYVVEGTLTFKKWIKRMGAVLFGKASGGGAVGSKKFRDTTDTVNRVDMTTDANGNRTSSTFDDTDT